MINSICYKLGKINIPRHNGEIQMRYFDMNTLKGVPDKFLECIGKMLEHLKVKEGPAWLTVDGRVIKENSSHRRGQPHIDGNYLPGIRDWGRGGWKVGNDGRRLSKEEHNESYNVPGGGLILTSDYSSCKGWKGSFNGVANTGGDCSHIGLNDGFILKENTIYYGNSSFIHESLPIDNTVHRTIVRVILPKEYKFEQLV